ncbi:phospholipase D-like domain-containing protein [Bacteriovorax sp. Seq25_V]|uniref:phospholipase D-like domain-containing protein n=1 Tax=Bacteriovorax sp. Seq25_V TaxID=1201288 RepID=UPI00038A4850|nr:phospholipase D-like domain-containing protein [Bacteriovorax sp. Seq25_V]EQC47289.1 PLD-like domain protein [Bacteriovorax sp. Seq25_V]
MIFLAANLFSDILQKVKKSKTDVTIFSPYVKISVLKELLGFQSSRLKRSIVINLSVQNIVNGSIDLEVLEYCINNNIKVYVNNDLHMKAYIYDMESAHIGSANCTNSGLGTNETPNLELLIYTNELPLHFLYYCNHIIHKSRLLSLDDLKRIYQIINDLEIPNTKIQEVELILKKDEPLKILASELPHTSNVDSIFFYIKNGEIHEDESYILHDIYMFDLQNLNASSLNEFKKKLEFRLFEHPFLKMIFDSFNESINFGMIRRLLEKKCEDDPRPSRIDVNVLINNLINWIESFDSENYEVIQPNHTKILRKK